MSNKIIIVKSNNQKGGITTGIIGKPNSTSNKKKVSIIAVIMLILAILTFFGVNNMFGKNKSPSEIYNVESHNQQGGITVGKIETVNVVNNHDSSKYIEPNEEIKSAVIKNLKNVAEKYNLDPEIKIEIESGNSIRNKIAIDFEIILQKNGFGYYPKGNTWSGRFPNYPISVFCKNIDFCKDIINGINPYIKGEFHFEIVESGSDNMIRIYFNGMPSFNEDGSVIFQ